jgi:hypothetical protein
VRTTDAIGDVAADDGDGEERNSEFAARPKG